MSRKILFGAPWCANCKVVKKRLESLGVIDFEYIDIEQNVSLAQQNGVRTLPTFVVDGVKYVSNEITDDVLTS